MSGPKANAPASNGAARARRLLWVVTGSVSASFVPFHLTSLQQLRPDIEIRMVLTRSAAKFVSRTALLALSSDAVWVDEWDTLGEGHSPHVEWSQWADAVLVYPATFSFVTRLASGNADTPAMLALQVAGAPIVLAPALPPGGDSAPAYVSAVQTLHRRPAVAVLPTADAISTQTRRRDAHAPASFPAAVDIALGGPGPSSAEQWGARGIIGHASNANVELIIRDLGSAFAVERTTWLAPSSQLPTVVGSWEKRATTVRCPVWFRDAALTFTDGPAAASRWLTSNIEPQIDAAVEALATAVNDLGELLVELPVRVPDVHTRAAPATLRRLAWHLEDGPEPTGAQHQLGANWRSDLRTLLDASSGTTPCFGDFGLGTVFPVPGRDSPAVDLLSSECIGVAGPGHDRGMLLGELAELRRSIAGLQANERLDALMSTLVTADDPAILAGTVRTAVLRMALHLLDFARFESATGDLTDKWTHLSEAMAAVHTDTADAARLLSRGVPNGNT
ncbi:flavoprotein [Rhodococcus sp. G-MC3]|uniref:flavoprotein n=1 Tax=Rhodococcus sp. G-MC3 TaxID=3046209 RepID=UPI0024BB0952|nr:flavoprotein [Rhodococcus sp. G-MC3]MDJ0393815.1 flavoprotein [Rhodococcus sp. G-MC3]